MRPGKQEWTGGLDLFRARLDQIINMRHELVRLAGTIDWDWIDGELAGCFSDEGRPGLSTRFMVGLLLLKHIYGLSDEEVCARWEFDPYFRAPRAHVSGMLRRKEEKNESLAPCCEGA